MEFHLSANENPHGASPKVHQALEENILNIHLYPEFNPITLKKKIGKKLNLSPDNIAMSAGSVKMIDRIIKTFVDTDEEVLTYERSFIAYGLIAEIYKKKCNYAPLTDFSCHIETLYPLINKNTKVIFIANPNNPTGTITTHTALKELLDNIPSDIFVVHDEAYIDYVTDTEYPQSLSLLKQYPNLILLRTFSKIYGLAGLRLGYAIANESVIQELNKKRLPYSINTAAICAGGIALDDDDYVNKCAEINHVERQLMYEKLLQSGYNVIPSQGNFIFIYFDSDEEKMKTFNQLKENGLFICNMEFFGQDRSLRISIGTEEANKRIVQCLCNSILI